MGRRTIVLVVALVLAAVSAFAVWQYLTNVREREREAIVEVKVWRAQEPIATADPGEEAKALIVESTALYENIVFEGSTILCSGPVSTSDDPTLCQANPSDIDSLLSGTVAAGPISAGQLITQEMFVTPAELNSISLSESIPQGKVAISIRPSEADAVGGFIRPGDRVNILASASIQLSQSLELLKNPDLRELLLGADFGGGTTAPPPTPGAPTEGEEVVDPVAEFVNTFPNSIQFTQTVLQNIEVLAIGADTRPSPLGTGLEPQGSQIVVLEVTPEQAEQVEFAEQYTSIELSLLPSEFPYTEFEARGVLVDDLFDVVTRIQEQLEAAFGS
jgi:Flp pilus assembly protein CpaB